MQPVSLKIIAFLALVQGLLGLLRASNWVKIGADLFGQGVLLLPAVGLLAIFRGLVIAFVALLYVSFFGAVLLEKSWARWIGVAAATINLLLALSALIQGASVLDVLAWSVIPLLLLFYVFSPTGREAFSDTRLKIAR
jgi:hypothetical protein